MTAKWNEDLYQGAIANFPPQNGSMAAQLGYRQAQLNRGSSGQGFNVTAGDLNALLQLAFLIAASAAFIFGLVFVVTQTPSWVWMLLGAITILAVTSKLVQIAKKNPSEALHLFLWAASISAGVYFSSIWIGIGVWFGLIVVGRIFTKFRECNYSVNQEKPVLKSVEIDLTARISFLQNAAWDWDKKGIRSFDSTHREIQELLKRRDFALRG